MYKPKGKSLSRMVDGERFDADVLPPNDTTAPVLAVDMNCNYYGNVLALSKMEEILGNAKKARE